MAMKNIAVKKVIQKLQPEEITTLLWDDNSVLHRHSDWEFTSTVDGTGCNVVNGTPYDLMPGDFVLLGPQHVHQYVSDKPIQRRDVCIATEKMHKCIGETTLKDNSYKSRITFPYATNAICKVYPCTSKGGNVLTYPEAYAFTYYLIEKYGFNNVLNCCINYNFDGVFGSNYNIVMDEFMKSIE